MFFGYDLFVDAPVKRTKSFMKNVIIDQNQINDIENNTNIQLSELTEHLLKSDTYRIYVKNKAEMYNGYTDNYCGMSFATLNIYDTSAALITPRILLLSDRYSMIARTSALVADSSDYA